ncbi:hypothetical protein BV22DRAFT_1118534 [Leucogyrophana mollusca]|uniref:Uncharacterized protein n=1 Tax=Leucogyrophana mollusca TaxID=85980 RepID=A0ACB8BN04_9AGAM|nr:hypothetical protein BV22DRAFT_1118534 [Leucogyrophana mollusca]
MGLAGRKQKQRIPADPRNLSWADDAARFGQSYLSKLGWDPSQGLGAAGDGMRSHLKVHQKLDMLGIGAAHQRDPHGVAWKQNRDFEALLRRLNEGVKVEGESAFVEEGQVVAEATAEAEDDKSSKKEKKRKRKDADLAEDGGEQDGKKKRKKEKKEKKEKKSKRSESVSPPPAAPQDPPTTSKITARPMAHRARFQASKRIAGKSAAAISEILGIAPTPTPTPASVSTLTPLSTPTPDSDLPLEKITTSTKSVADYFKEKLGAKSGTNYTDAAETEDRGYSRGLGASRSGIGAANSFAGGDGDDGERVRGGIGSSSKLSSFANFVSLSAPPPLPVDEASENDGAEGTKGDEESERRRRKKDERKKEKKKKERDALESGRKDQKKRESEPELAPPNLEPLPSGEPSQETLAIDKEADRKARKAEKKARKKDREGS